MIGASDPAPRRYATEYPPEPPTLDADADCDD